MLLPIPPTPWLEKSALIDDVVHGEAVKLLLEWIGRDEGAFLTWSMGELEAEDLIVMNTAFAVALVYLQLNWSAFKSPVFCLEELVSVFGVTGIDAMWVGDGNLPPHIAGAGADDRKDFSSYWEFRLHSYVCALFKDGWLSKASPLAARYDHA